MASKNASRRYARNPHWNPLASLRDAVSLDGRVPGVFASLDPRLISESPPGLILHTKPRKIWPSLRHSREKSVPIGLGFGSNGKEDAVAVRKLGLMFVAGEIEGV